MLWRDGRASAAGAGTQQRRNRIPHQRGETLAVGAGGEGLRILYRGSVARRRSAGSVAGGGLCRHPVQRPLSDVSEVSSGFDTVLLGALQEEHPRRTEIRQNDGSGALLP